MYKRLSSVLFPIMTFAFIGAAVWGYQENQEKNAILIKAENQYQRAFHDLSFHMDQLHTELGKTIAVQTDSTDYFRRGLANIWRLTSQAQNEINQLPLTLLPFNQTEEFLSNISKFSYQTAIRDLSQKPLSEEELKALHTLYARSEELRNDIRQVQGKVLANNLRWMDVEVALASQSKQLDNTIVDGFKTVDKKVSEYGEVSWGPSMASLYQNRKVSMLGGNEITEVDAKQKAAQFLGQADGKALKAVENGTGTEYTSYSVFGKPVRGETAVQMDFTKKGGHLIYFMAPREVEAKNVDLNGAREAAQDFLQQHGYMEMVPVQYDEYNNVASITFARKVGDVTIYPEKLVVKVALDHAEITGLHAADYIYEHKDRELPKAKLTSEQAQKELNPNFKLESQTMALIRNDLEEEVLCFEFNGRINGASYKVFINADNGIEEKIEQYELEENR